MGIKETERKTWIDLLKGLLILFVILGHTTTNKIVINWLSSFYMPCFFMLSGWLMKKEGDAKQFICKKIKGILFPYIFFALVWVLFCFAKNLRIESGFNIFGALLSIVLPYSGRIGGNAYNLWFLPCLFLSQTLVALFVYKKKFWKLFIGMILGIFFVLGILVTSYCSLLYATAVASIFVGLGFYISNEFLPKVQKRIETLLVWLFFIVGGLHIGLLTLNLYLTNTILDFSAASFGILPIYMLCALCGSLFFIGVISRIKKAPSLEYIGKNSLVYYALHYEVLAVTSFVIVKFISQEFLTAVVSFILTLALTTVVVWIYNKLNVGKLFK